MPTLDWIGKHAVERHHEEVSFHLLEQDEELSAGENDSGNLLVEGDNLLALKALLPRYAGKVKCIYIDPPYNTGNEGWIYNDNVNSTEIREWLGKTVGREAEDLSRHDKWLSMMYPRLQLLKKFLRDDGAIFVSIDDNEVANLRLLMDEIFGAKNFVACVIWQKIYTVKNSAKYLSDMHDYIAIYACNKDKWNRHLQPREEKQKEDYTNPDNDPNGVWISNALQARNFYSAGVYSIKCPSGRVIDAPPSGTYWRMNEEKFWELDRKGEVWWGKDGNNSPRIKKYLKDAKEGVVPATMWFHESVGTNSEAKTELRNILSDAEMFITPKPTRLIKRILQLASDKDSIILDSFAGSGTTAHAVMRLNKEDGGNRRFILVEMDAHISRNITAERLRRVINGYTVTKTNGKQEEVEGLGSGFSYCTLGLTLFDSTGQIRADVSFSELAQHIFFTETGMPLSSVSDAPLIGVANDTAVYLLNGTGALNTNALASLPKHDGTKIIYGKSCRISTERLRREGITFKQIPYQIRVS